MLRLALLLVVRLALFPVFCAFCIYRLVQKKLHKV